MWLDKKAIINALTKEDVIKICLDLGSEDYRITNGAVIFQTIDHNVSGGSYKLYYYHEAKSPYPAKIFHVYTTGETLGIIELVIRAKTIRGESCDYRKALYYIAKLTNHVITADKEEDTQQETIASDFDFINAYKSIKQESIIIEPQPTYNEHILEVFTYLPHEEFLKDHITVDAMQDFEIGYWDLTNQITIPHRDVNARLIGVRARNLDKKQLDEGRKYVPMVVQNQLLNHQLGLNLYGLYITKQMIKKVKRAVVFEAEKSVLQSQSYYGENNISVATCGSNLSNEHVELLRQCGVEEIVLAYDKEFKDNNTLTEEIYRNKLFKKIQPYVNEFNFSFIWDKENLLEQKDSPTDKGQEIYEHLFEMRIPITASDINLCLRKDK